MHTVQTEKQVAIFFYKNWFSFFLVVALERGFEFNFHKFADTLQKDGI